MKHVLIAALSAVLLSQAAVAKSTKSKDAETPAPVAMSDLRAAADANMLEQLKTLIERAQLAQQSGPELTLYLSEYYLGKGAFQQALAGFQTVLGEESIAARAYQGSGIAAFGLARYGEAITFLKQATVLDPTQVRSWNTLGAAADATRNWALAEDSYAEALKLAPGDANLLSNRGYSRILQRRDDAAITDLTKAVMAAPKSERIKTNLRIALALSGRYEEAMAGTDTRKQHVQLNTIGYAAMLRGDYDLAESYFTRAIERSDIYYEPAHKNLIALEDMRRRTPHHASLEH